MLVQDAVEALNPQSRIDLIPDFSRLPPTLHAIEPGIHERIVARIPEWAPDWLVGWVVERVDFGELVHSLVRTVNGMGLPLPRPNSNEAAKAWLARAVLSLEPRAEEFTDRWVAELVDGIAPWWLRLIGGGALLKRVVRALIPDLAFDALRRAVA